MKTARAKPAANTPSASNPEWMKQSAAAGRVLVGAVMVFAAMSKLAAPTQEFAAVIMNYDLLPPSAAMPMAGILPWIELAAGWAMILGFGTRFFAGVCSALTGAFVLALTSALLRGIDLPHCGCFGDGVHIPLPLALAFDVGLCFLSWWAWQNAPDGWSMDSWCERGL